MFKLQFQANVICESCASDMHNAIAPMFGANVYDVVVNLCSINCLHNLYARWFPTSMMIKFHKNHVSLDDVIDAISFPYDAESRWFFAALRKIVGNTFAPLYNNLRNVFNSICRVITNNFSSQDKKLYEEFFLVKI